MSADPVGSLAEEAAKLIAAVQGWTHEMRDRDSDDHAHDHDPDELSLECRYCPVCNVARLAKAATPEVRDHLASAGLSLALAFKELMDNVAPRPEPTPVEKIDLEE